MTITNSTDTNTASCIPDTVLSTLHILPLQHHKLGTIITCILQRRKLGTGT